MTKARNIILDLSLHCLNFTLNYITLKIWRKKQMWNPYQTKKITMHAWIYLNYGLRISVGWLISNALHVYNNKRQDDSQYNCPPPQSAASRTDVTITHKRISWLWIWLWCPWAKRMRRSAPQSHWHVRRCKWRNLENCTKQLQFGWKSQIWQWKWSKWQGADAVLTKR